MSPTCKSFVKKVPVPTISTVLFRTFAVPLIRGGWIWIVRTEPLPSTVLTAAAASMPYGSGPKSISSPIL